MRVRATERIERPQRVLMVRLDRLGRGLGLEALAALSEIVQLGVTIYTCQDGDYTLSRASESLLPLMRIVTGAIENEAVAIRLELSMRGAVPPALSFRISGHMDCASRTGAMFQMSHDRKQFGSHSN